MGKETDSITLTKEEFIHMKAIIHTFNYFHSGRQRGICPKCKEYIIIDGYVCFGCGFDPTDTNN